MSGEDRTGSAGAGPPAGRPHPLGSSSGSFCLLGSGVLSQVLALCSECLEKQKDVLADTHLYHLRVLSAAVQVLSYLRCFPEAAAYACRLVQGYA